MAYKVFISYSTRDLPSVDALRGWLTLSDVEVFVSEYSVAPGAPLTPTIEANIRNCDLFVLLWSHNARTSDWVPQEIGIAHAQNRVILPIVLQDGLELPGFIKDVRYIAAFRDPQSAAQQLRDYVASNSMIKHNQQAALLVLAIGGFIFWILKKG